MRQPKPNMKRREFLENVSRKVPGIILTIASVSSGGALLAQPDQGEYDPEEHNYAMGIDIHKCIGCGRCASACKQENK
ncbi:MAG: 4Fe-4S binding protein, partial [Candidatus Zixiibacteriota bacterium]